MNSRGCNVIDRKYQRYVFSFIMALLMSCLMSLVITACNVGLVDDLLVRWLKAWAFAFSVALPAILVIGPLVNRLVAAVLKEE